MNGHSSSRNRIRLALLGAATIIIIATVHYIGLTNRSKVLTEKLDESLKEKKSLSLTNADLEKQIKKLAIRLDEKVKFYESDNNLKDLQIQKLMNKNSNLDLSKTELTGKVERLKIKHEKLRATFLKMTEERDHYENKTKFLTTQLSDMKDQGSRDANELDASHLDLKRRYEELLRSCKGKHSKHPTKTDDQNEGETRDSEKKTAAIKDDDRQSEDSGSKTSNKRKDHSKKEPSDHSISRHSKQKSTESNDIDDNDDNSPGSSKELDNSKESVETGNTSTKRKSDSGEGSNSNKSSNSESNLVKMKYDSQKGSTLNHPSNDDNKPANVKDSNDSENSKESDIGSKRDKLNKSRTEEKASESKKIAKAKISLKKDKTKGGKSNANSDNAERVVDSDEPIDSNERDPHDTKDVEKPDKSALKQQEKNEVVFKDDSKRKKNFQGSNSDIDVSP